MFFCYWQTTMQWWVYSPYRKIGSFLTNKKCFSKTAETTENQIARDFAYQGTTRVNLITSSCSSIGRALVLWTRGHGFDSHARFFFHRSQKTNRANIVTLCRLKHRDSACAGATVVHLGMTSDVTVTPRPAYSRERTVLDVPSDWSSNLYTRTSARGN